MEVVIVFKDDSADFYNPSPLSPIPTEYSGSCPFFLVMARNRSTAMESEPYYYG